MSIVTQPLREEHQDLFPHVLKLREAADAVGDLPTEQLRPLVDEAYNFLASHLLAHAQAEEQALYPVVARVMGAPEATATMRRDHVAIGQLIEELGGLRDRLDRGDLDDAEVKDLRRVLYGLYALVGVHFAKEEEVYLPLLDERLSASEATAMFEAMEAAAHAAKHSLHA